MPTVADDLRRSPGIEPMTFEQLFGGPGVELEVRGRPLLGRPQVQLGLVQNILHEILVLASQLGGHVVQGILRNEMQR